MKLLAKDKAGFRKLLDPSCDPQKSIILRYQNVFEFSKDPKKDAAYKEWLRKTSIQEGAKIFSFLKYRGVEVYILDTASLMHTKTLKALDGCVSIAHCKLNGYSRVAFETGGNTGAALTAYGLKAGLETFLFIPEDNLDLLDSGLFDPPKSHLIAVASPRLVKKAGRMFANMRGLKHIPQLSWRYEAAMFRGLFVLERLLKGMKFDWLTQTISAAFGPIGIYKVLNNFKKEIRPLPRFLGIQQEANCPMVRFWKTKGKSIGETRMDSTRGLLTKVMYDIKPQTYGSYNDLCRVLASSKGGLTTINRAEFSDLLKCTFNGKDVLGLLKEHGVFITSVDGDIVDKTGLIALAGTLKEIRSGKIARGSKVLCCLTSGPSEADGKARPEFRISCLADLTKYAKNKTS